MSKCLIYRDPEHQCSEYPVKCDNCHCQANEEGGAYVCREPVPPLMWRHAKAGRSFGKDTIVIYDGDPDPRLVRCAVNDCVYIHVDDLKKLPIDEQK